MAEHQGSHIGTSGLYIQHVEVGPTLYTQSQTIPCLNIPDHQLHPHQMNSDIVKSVF